VVLKGVMVSRQKEIESTKPDEGVMERGWRVTSDEVGGGGEGTDPLSRTDAAPPHELIASV